MRTLVIDTATEACSVALFEDERLIARHHAVVGRGHAERLLPLIAGFPDKGRAERIAVDIGPGSFTGVRIGIAAARALAYGWGSALAGYSALASVAAAVRAAGHADDVIAIAMTGGHGELFWQRFGGPDMAPLDDPASTPVDVLARQLRDERIYGTGAEALVSARGWGVAVPRHPDAGDFPLLPPAFATLPPRPLYGRGADARPRP